MVCVKRYPHECQDPRFLSGKFQAKENKMGIGPLVTPQLTQMFSVIYSLTETNPLPILEFTQAEENRN